MLCSVYNVHYTLKPTSNYSGTLDTLKRQLNQVLRLYLGGAVGSVVYKIKDEFRERYPRTRRASAETVAFGHTLKEQGTKIWGQERTQSEFHESNNCKDPLYCW